MRIRLTLAATLLALTALPASAELKQVKDWLAACDNTRTCTALGVQEWAGRVGLRLDRAGAGDAAPSFTILVYADEGVRFTFAFDDAALGGLPKGEFTSKSGDDVTRIAIAADATEAFIAALRKGNKIIVTNLAPKSDDERVIGEISLSGAVAAMLWIDEQQKRLDTTTALIRRGAKPASAVPGPPALPVVQRQTADPAPAAKTFPPAVLAKGPTICGPEDPSPEPGEINALSGGFVLYAFECRKLSGAYNVSTGYVIAPRDRPEAARVLHVPYPPGERPKDATEERLLLNSGLDEKTLTLTMFAKSRGIGDCGTSGAWVFDGKDFRLTHYRSMPICGGLLSDDWPVLYRAEVK